tara:strand:- start:256 stop:774 length:519 start_codon:yes stop_codon:yes gene_type:complete
MIEKNHIRLKNRKGQKVLEVWQNGRWHSIVLENRQKSIVKERPRQKALQVKKLRQDRWSKPESRDGMSDPGDATVLSLKTRVSYLRTLDAGTRQWFSLPMGTEGQEKILIVREIGLSPTLPRIKITTKQGDEVYRGEKKGQVLHLICDGTCWYPVTSIDSTDANGPGKWNVE